MTVTTQQQVDDAEQVIDFLKANPHLWNQHCWIQQPDHYDWSVSLLTESHSSEDRLLTKPEALSCSTAGCMAGWLALFKGEGVYFMDGSPRSPLVKQGERFIDLAEWATDRLGLENTSHEDGEIARMFYEGNTIHDLEAWLDAMRTSFETGQDLVLVADERELISRYVD